MIDNSKVRRINVNPMTLTLQDEIGTNYSVPLSLRRFDADTVHYEAVMPLMPSLDDAKIQELYASVSELFKVSTSVLNMLRQEMKRRSLTMMAPIKYYDDNYYNRRKAARELCRCLNVSTEMKWS